MSLKVEAHRHHPLNSPKRDVSFHAGVSKRGASLGLKVERHPYGRIAVGTGIPAVAALATLIALAIIFSPASLVFLIAAPIAGVALIALGVTTIVFAAKAAQVGKEALNL